MVCSMYKKVDLNSKTMKYVYTTVIIVTLLYSQVTSLNFGWETHSIASPVWLVKS